MKKLVSALLLTSMLISSNYLAFAEIKISDEKIGKQMEEQAKKDKDVINIDIFIDGKELKFKPEEKMGMPFIDANGRTLVPMRKPIELSGNKIEWDNKNKTATVTSKFKIVKVKIGDKFLKEKKIADKDFKKTEMDTKAIIKNGRTYIPLRAVMESIGLSVSYNNKTKTISAINKDSKVWDKSEIDTEFPELNKLLNKYKLYDGTVGYNNFTKIETIKLDNSLQDKLKLGQNNGSKWLEVHNQEKNQRMALIKDGKMVYKSHINTDSSYGRNHGYMHSKYKENGDGYEIEKVDYILLYKFDNPIATIVENPFKK